MKKDSQSLSSSSDDDETRPLSKRLRLRSASPSVSGSAKSGKTSKTDSKSSKNRARKTRSSKTASKSKVRQRHVVSWFFQFLRSIFSRKTRMARTRRHRLIRAPRRTASASLSTSQRTTSTARFHFPETPGASLASVPCRGTARATRSKFDGIRERLWLPIASSTSQNHRWTLEFCQEKGEQSCQEIWFDF